MPHKQEASSVSPQMEALPVARYEPDRILRRAFDRLRASYVVDRALGHDSQHVSRGETAPVLFAGKADTE